MKYASGDIQRVIYMSVPYFAHYPSLAPFTRCYPGHAIVFKTVHRFGVPAKRRGVLTNDRRGKQNASGPVNNIRITCAHGSYFLGSDGKKSRHLRQESGPYIDGLFCTMLLKHYIIIINWKLPLYFTFLTVSKTANWILFL